MSARPRHATAGGRSARIMVVLLVTLLQLGVAATGSPARGQDTPTPAPAPMTLSLEDIDGLLPGDDGGVSLRLRMDAGAQPRDDLRLVMSVHQRVTDRDALSRALDDLPDTVFTSVSQDVADMAEGTSRLVDVAATAETLALAGEDREGVYPVRVELFQGVDPVAALTTSIVVVPENPPPALWTSLVLRVDLPGTPSQDDVVDPALERAVRPGGATYDALFALDRHRRAAGLAGVTLVADGRALEDLRAMADGFARPDGQQVGADDRPARAAAGTLDRLRAAARRADTMTLPLPYGPADIVALTRGGEPGLAVDAVTHGPVATAEVLQTEVSEQVLVPPDGLDAATLAAVAPAGGEVVLLDAPYLAVADRDAMTPLRELRTPDGGRVSLLVGDPALSRLLTDAGGAGPAVVTQRLLAETAVIWLSGEGDPAVAPVISTSTDAVDPEILPAVLRAMRDAPWLRPVNLRGLLAEVGASERLVRLAYPVRAESSELSSSYVGDLGAAHDALEPLSSLLGTESAARADQIAELRSAASIGYRPADARATGHARADAVLQRLSTLSSAVEIITGPPITLTSATGDVPVTLVNRGDVPLQIEVGLASTGFAFDGGPARDLTLAPSEATTVTFRARALNPGGLAAVQVLVEDAAGIRTLTSTTIAVRSTAVPIVALLAIVGGSLGLLVWGIRSSRRRRAGRGEAPGTPTAEVA